jgi:hypothetical protein
MENSLRISLKRLFSIPKRSRLRIGLNKIYMISKSPQP